MIVMMQQIVARRVDPMEMAVFSWGSIHGGDAPNVIPAEVKFGGVTRAYSESVRSVIKEQVQAIAKVSRPPPEIQYIFTMPTDIPALSMTKS